MYRRSFLAALAVGCTDRLITGRAGGKLGPQHGVARVVPVVRAHDLRHVLPASELLAYWDLRASVPEARESVTLGSTLAVTGATLPTVTIDGPLSPPREVRIDYPVGGARGTASYRIFLDGNERVLAGTTSAEPVDIGRGHSIAFSDDAEYTVNTTAKTATVHRTEVVSWAELTGREDCTLVNTLSGKGLLYEAYGLNARQPSLYMSRSALHNDAGVPALASGMDTPLEVWMLYETWSLITSGNSMVPWAFVHQSDTTKSFLQAVFTGPMHEHPSKLGLSRRDSGESPATTNLFTDIYRTDAAPHVHRYIVSGNANIHTDNAKGKALDDSLDRGIATNLNRFILGGSKRGTDEFDAKLWCSGRITALAITSPLSSDNALLACKALAGVS